MAGYYIHIPFCKQACHYCNFHFSTSLQAADRMVAALISEINLRKDECTDEIETIYFGGGTPSLLSAPQIESILLTLRQNHAVSSTVEITLEANPDDLSAERLKLLREAGVNRLSIGIQSFHERDLQWMNRSHNARQSIQCLTEARKLNFKSISCDLIYGSPTTSDEMFRQNIDQLIEFEIGHISAYALTVEPKTALAAFIQKGTFEEPQEKDAERQFQILRSTLLANGFEHYEISNFAQPSFQSRHNSNYWSGKQYIGIGPSAHSYSSPTRSWNIANNAAYMKSIEDSNLPSESEILTERDHYNESIMLGLRTAQGFDIEQLRQSPFWKDSQGAFELLLNKKLVVQEGQRVRVSETGLFLTDGIAAQLFAD